MSQAEIHPRATQRIQKASVDTVGPGRGDVDRDTRSAKCTAIFIAGSTGLITLCFAWLLTTFVAAAAFAQESKVSGAISLPVGTQIELNASTSLPPLESIDAKTDITVFLQSGVPATLRLAALRRAWTMDPAIRDFKGLQENAWNFNDKSSIPGFGELGPEIDTTQMQAQLMSQAPRSESRSPMLFTSHH